MLFTAFGSTAVVNGDTVDMVGLARPRDVHAVELPMGAQKRLEVTRALMARPRLLLLDEPAAGLNDAETADLAALLRAIRDSGATVLLVEHKRLVPCCGTRTSRSRRARS